MVSRFKRDFLTKILNVAWGFLLSGSVRVRDLPYYRNTTSITDFRSLHCDFSRPCRWSTDGETKNGWGLATGQPDQFIWLAATGTNLVPVEPFALLSTRGFNGSDTLVSDEIPCQGGDGLLQFNYWITSGALARVCSLSKTKETELFCSEHLDHSPTPGEAEIHIPGPIDEPFKLAIIAGGEGFIVVDDLRYSGKPCQSGSREKRKKKATKSSEEPTDSSASEAAFKHGEFLLSLSVHRFKGNKIQNGYLQDTDDLTCDFSLEWPCKWGPINKRAYTIDGNLNPETWEMKTSTNLQPILPAGFLKYGSEGISSSIVPCQSSDGQIFLRWWVSKDVSVQVCAISVEGGERIKCSEHLDKSHAEYPGPTVIDFSDPIQQSFTWHIRPDWSKTSNGFVVLDELSYFGDICEGNKASLKTNLTVPDSSGSAVTAPSTTTSSTPASTVNPGVKVRATTTAEFLTTHHPFWKLTTERRTTSGATRFLTPPPLRRKTTEFVTLTPRIIQPALPLCRALNCNFNDGYCEYRTSPFGSTGWYHRSTPFGRPMSRLTDIRIEKTTGHFLGALLFPHYMAVLQSPDFEVHTLNILYFNYYRASAGANIRICFETNNFKLTTSDELKHCRTIIPELTVYNARKWNGVRVMLLPGYTKFFLVAEHIGISSGYAAVGIDDIVVRNC